MRKPKNMKKRNSLIATGIVVFVSALVFLVWSSGPSKSDVSRSTQAVKGATSQDLSTYVMQYDQLSIQVPSRFVSKTKKQGVGTPLYVQELLAEPVKDVKSIFGDQLAVSIGALPVDGLKGVSDMSLRLNDKSYNIEKISDFSMQYDKTDTSYEVGAFVQKNGIYASFVLTGSQTKSASLKTELEAIVASISWR